MAFSDLLTEDLSSLDSCSNGALTVGTTQVEAKVGGSPLIGRRTLIIYNNSNDKMYWGATGVTASNGIPIERGNVAIIQASDSLSIFVIGDDTGLNARIAELT